MAADSAKSAKVSKQISQFRELLDYFEHGVINQDPTVVGIVVAIALVLLTVREYSLEFTIHLEGSPFLELATCRVAVARHSVTHCVSVLSTSWI